MRFADVCEWLHLPRLKSTWQTVADELQRSQMELYKRCWEQIVVRVAHRQTHGSAEPQKSSPVKRRRSDDEEDLGPSSSVPTPMQAVEGEVEKIAVDTPLSKLNGQVRLRLVHKIYLELAKRYAVHMVTVAEMFLEGLSDGSIQKAMLPVARKLLQGSNVRRPVATNRSSTSRSLRQFIHGIRTK